MAGAASSSCGFPSDHPSRFLLQMRSESDLGTMARGGEGSDALRRWKLTHERSALGADC